MENLTSFELNFWDDNGSSSLQHEAMDLPDYYSLIAPVATIFYVIIFVVGVIGNLLVCYVVLAYRDMRDNISHVFLANLSIADLLVVLVCVPTAMVDTFSQEIWYLGREMCIAVPFLEYSVTHVSVLTMLAISFERLLAIVFPLKATYLISRHKSSIIIIVIWIIAFLSSVPFVFIAKFEYVPHQVTADLVPTCVTPHQTPLEQAYLHIVVTIFFTLPFFILVVLYAVISYHLIRDSYTSLGVASESSKANMRARRSVVIMLATVVATFFICLLPFRVLSLWSMYATAEWYQQMGPVRWYSLLYFTRVMFYLNSSINPLVLYAMSAKFRTKFQHILCCRAPPIGLSNNVSRTGTLRYSMRAPTNNNNNNNSDHHSLSRSSSYRMDDSSSLKRKQYANGNNNISSNDLIKHVNSLKKTTTDMLQVPEEYPML